MSLLPKKSFEFSKKEYWDAFFNQRGKKSFEWYGEYPELSTYLHKYIKRNDLILMLGCGNSKLSADLYDIGYRNQTNIDISSKAIKQMNSLHNADRPDLLFLEMDALNMTFDSEKFQVALDKGTLDALLSDENPETVQNVKKYFDEIDRVLKICGRYMVVSLLQKHILQFLLDYFIGKGWMIRVHRCLDAEAKTQEEQGSKPLPVFMVICTKVKQLPQSKPILELCLNSEDTPMRVADPEKIVERVVDMQKMAIVCAGLQRTTTAGKEIVLEVGQDEIETPKYTLYIVDKLTVDKISPSLGQYAAFIVPQGRETEWAFGSPEGRQYLTKEAKVDRLVVVTLNRGHHFNSLEEVKAELSPFISDFAPLQLKKKIPFLSVSDSVGTRTQLQTGESPVSGKYLVEETQGDGGAPVRRLYFLSAKNIIQSEARIRKVKTRRGGEKVIVDTNSLSCTHHAFMCAGAFSVVEQNSQSRLLVVGLGGGSLCSYLRKVLPKSFIKAVELDPEMLNIATKFFGLVEDKQLIVVIKDGLDYIKEAASKGEEYDIIMFDVDNKNIQTGLSCPPPSFLEPELLQQVNEITSPQGVFILNLVCRDASLSQNIHQRLKNMYGTVGSIKLDDDLNEIIYCYPSTTVEFKNVLSRGTSNFNQVIEVRKLDKMDCISLSNVMGLLDLSGGSEEKTNGKTSRKKGRGKKD